MGGAGLSSTLQGGGSVNAVGGGFGIAVNTFSALKSYDETREAFNAHQEASESLAELEAQGAPELYAAIQILEREQANARQGMAEGGASLIAAINGVGNGISTFINGFANAFSYSSVAAATVIATATFAIGAGLNALMGTISGIRDIRTGIRRTLKRGATQELLDFCEKLSTQQEASLAAKRARIDELKEIEGNLQAELLTSQARTLADDLLAAKLQQLKNVGQEVVTLGEEVAKDGDQVSMLTKMVGGLSVSARKQRAKEKGGTAFLNLTGAAGGAALLAATIGGVAAAATPIGWALSGIAAVSILIYTFSKFYKRKIRNSNVIRMRQEKAAIEAALSADPPTTTWHSAWNRDDFPTDEKKSRLNRFLNEIAPWKSKGKSGQITIGDRLNQLDAYLAKYDVESAGDAVYEGIAAALTQDVGDQSVEVADGQTKTFREAVAELLTALGLEPSQIIVSLQSEDPQDKEAAERLLKQKMKLLPTDADESAESDIDEAQDTSSISNSAAQVTEQDE